MRFKPVRRANRSKRGGLFWRDSRNTAGAHRPGGNVTSYLTDATGCHQNIQFPIPCDQSTRTVPIQPGSRSRGIDLVTRQPGRLPQEPEASAPGATRVATESNSPRSLLILNLCLTGPAPLPRIQISIAAPESSPVALCATVFLPRLISYPRQIRDVGTISLHLLPSTQRPQSNRAGADSSLTGNAASNPASLRFGLESTTRLDSPKRSEPRGVHQTNQVGQNPDLTTTANCLLPISSERSRCSGSGPDRHGPAGRSNPASIRPIAHRRAYSAAARTCRESPRRCA